jgi:hypothetical protein
MAIIDAGNIGLGAPDDWEGSTIVPFETEPDSGIKVVAATNRDILLRVGNILVPMDSLSIQNTENIVAVHGSTRGKAYALAGGDIDTTYTVEFGSWLEAGQQDALRQALFTLHENRAVYHSVYVTYLGDPAKGWTGRHPLLTLRKCKAKADSWTFSQGGPSKSKFDGMSVDYFFFGRNGV